MENHDQYAALTRAHDWAGIFELNGIKFDSFGTKKELGVLHNYLEEDEVVYAIVSGVMSQTATSNALDFGTNTWIAALTNERFLCLDHAMLTTSVDTQSIRLENVQAVSASQGLILGKVTIDLGSRTVIIDNCLKESVPVMATLANKLLKEARAAAKAQASEGVATAAPAMSPLDKLEAVNRLHKLSVITDEECIAARERILASSEMAAFKSAVLS